MPKVFVAQHHAEAHLVQGLLSSFGIEAEVRGEALFTTVEGAPVIPGAQPEVWVQNLSQVPQATDLVTRFSKGEGMVRSSGPSWTCPKCNEEHESQFTSCWKCGTPKA